MKFHPLQGHKESIDRLSEIFRVAMEKNGVLPRDPWRAKRLSDWLAKMGAKFHPGSFHRREWGQYTDAANYVNFRVTCQACRRRIRGYRESRYVHVEIPWELADKVLMLGYLP